MYSPERLAGLQELLIDILRAAPVSFAILFGSAGREEAFRDLDVAVQFLPGHTGLSAALDLGLRLEQATGLPIDLVSLEEAPVAFQYEVSKGKTLTVADREAFCDWRERTWTNYFEIQHFLRSHALDYAKARAHAAGK